MVQAVVEAVLTTVGDFQRHLGCGYSNFGHRKRSKEESEQLFRRQGQIRPAIKF